MTTSTLAAPPFAEASRLCRQAQLAWADVAVRQRLRPVRQFRHGLVRHADRLCAAVGRDIGKPAAEALATELLPLAEAARFVEREASRLLRPRRVPTRHRPLWLWRQSDTVHRRPRGVVGIIGTWNYPLFLNGVQILQALAAGNGVLWKPSEVAPASADALAELLRECHFPPNLLQVLPATREAGRELADADVDHIVFTGSSATGRRLAEHLGRRLITSTLELSGCDALVVLDDADVAMAARAAWFGTTLNNGQTCLAVRRAFVQRAAYRPFLDVLRPLAEAASPVRVALACQAEQADRLVREAVADGACLLAPGDVAAGGDRVRPAVVADARPDMAVCREASFAPLLAVLPFDTPEDALRDEARCTYALGASIITRNPARAERLATRLRAGAVVVNDVIAATAHPATPFGGRGESGWGSTQGAEGLLELTVPQVLSVRGGCFRPHYEPAGSAKGIPAAALQGMLTWGHAATWRQRLGGFWRLIRGWSKGS
jgi:acyl-CoA reductase-like NAD-dependent aldehyde dehydrogenase